MTDGERRLRFVLMVVIAALLVHLNRQRLRDMLDWDVHNPDAVPRIVTPRGDLAADEKSAIEVFENNSSSVVFVMTLVSATQINPLAPAKQLIPAGIGSGFIWERDSHRYVVTNYHVIAAATRGGACEVTLTDGTLCPAEIVGTDPNSDLAVLRIKAPREKLKPIVIGESSNLKVGQKVFVIGAPLGLRNSMTSGIISALGRNTAITSDGQNRKFSDLIQTDAPINRGNSGGPLLDSAGRLIGVTTLRAERDDAQNIGFAVPVETINDVVPQLIRSGRVLRLDLGATYLTSESALRFRVQRGVVIHAVMPDGSAGAAGLRGITSYPGFLRFPGGVKPARLNLLGDTIIEVDGHAVNTEEELIENLRRFKVGDNVPLTVRRNSGQVEKISVRL